MSTGGRGTITSTSGRGRRQGASHRPGCRPATGSLMPSPMSDSWTTPTSTPIIITRRWREDPPTTTPPSRSGRTPTANPMTITYLEPGTNATYGTELYDVVTAGASSTDFAHTGS